MDINIQFDRLNSIIPKILLKINIENKLEDYFFNHLCEDLFTVTFSELINNTFTNINIENPNAPGIDLLSKDKKICVQISSTGTTAKLYKSLRTFLKQENYKECEKFYFFIIGEKEQSYSEAKKIIKKILVESTVKITGFNFDVDNDIIELKHLSKTLKDKFSDLYGNNERKLSHESLFRIVEDLSKSVNGIEYALKPIQKNENVDFLKNDCLEKPKSISRRLIDEENNVFSEEDLTIKDELKYAFIYGDAGLGKTHLLNKLSFELFEKSTNSIENIVPFVINLKKIKFNISLEKQLPQYFGKRFKSILIFDGYDEITIREQNQFKSLLIQYLELNKNTSCIIGSRTKIKNNEIKLSYCNDSEEKIYYFKTLKIDFFNDNEINDFIKNKEIDNSIFSDKNFQKLYGDFKNPYYLDLITSYYKDYGNLPENKLIVLNKLINKNLIRLASNDNRMLALETRKFLEKISFIFYHTEIKFLKDIELAKIIEYKNDIWKLLEKHDVLSFNEVYEHWEISLTKQKELDFLFYSLIKRLDSKVLFEIFKEDTILPDAWYNSLLLFNDDDEICYGIRNEMTKRFPFIYIKEFQSNPNDSFFTDDLRKRVFQEIFNKYEEKDIWIDFKIFDEKSYVEFGDTDENFNFLILKVSSENQRTKRKAISLLSNFKPNDERSKTLLSLLESQINKIDNKYLIKDIYDSLSKYKNFISKEKQIQLVDISVKSEIEFLKYNEYVRSGVYNFILSCDLQDEFLEYLLEGLELIKFSNKGKHNGRDKTTLLDEGFYLDRLFFNLKSKNNIIKSFEKLFHNYRKYDDNHASRIFNDLILKSTNIITAEKNIKTFKKKIISILSKYDVKNDNWGYWKEMILNFKLDSFIIDTLNAEYEILESLIVNKNIFKNHFLISADGISDIITNNNYKLIIKVIDKELINIYEATRIYEFIENKNKNIAKEFKKIIIKKGGKIESNYEKKQNTILKEQLRNFELLFKKEEFKKSIINFFAEKKDIDLPWDNIPDWYKDKLYYNNDVRIEFLRQIFIDNDEKRLKKIDVINKLKNDLDWYLANMIFQRKDRLNYNLNEKQILSLSVWVKTEASKLNFRDAITKVQNLSFSINQNCLTIYKYIKELNVKVDKQTSLDLLSFVDINSIDSNYNETYSDYFENLIIQINDQESVKKRVNENLKRKVKYSSVLNNHIIFSFTYNIIENYKLIEDLLIEFLPELQVGHYHNNPVIVYYDKSKNFEFIKNIFPKKVTDLFWVIIDYLIENNEHIKFVEEKLLLNIDKIEDYNEKLKFSSKLLKINSKNALSKFYTILHYIKENQLKGQFRLHDFNKSIHDYKNVEIETAVNLLELSYKYEFDNFENPTREVSAYLKRMVIEDKENYDKIKGLISNVIKSNKGIIDNIQFLEYELNNLNEVFYLNYKSNYSLKDALKIISKI